VSWFELTDVLRRLVEEEIGVGDLPRILEALAQCAANAHDTQQLAEVARHALRGQITAKFVCDRQPLTVLQLDAQIEAAVSGALEHTSSGPYLALQPELAQGIIDAIGEQRRALGEVGARAPMLVDTVDIRPYLRRLLRLEFPELHVLSRQDIALDVPIRVLARICPRASS
jgi:type III secretion protein V